MQWLGAAQMSAALEGLPLPEAAPGSLREGNPELPGKQDQLPAMVALMRNEIRQDMPDIEGEIAPYIGGRRGDPAPVGAPKPQEFLDGGGTVAKGPDKVRLLD